MASARPVLMESLLSGVFHPGCAFCRRDAIGRAAFSAHRFDAGIALLNDDGLARHGFADQALGLFAHRLLRHPLLPVVENATDPALYTRSASCDQPCCEKTSVRSRIAPPSGQFRFDLSRFLLRDSKSRYIRNSG